MFEYAKNNTNDQCKRMSSSYYFITNIDVNTTNNEMLHDKSMTDSIPLVQSESSHPPVDTYYNITVYNIEQQVADGQSDEPMFVDPGVEEDGIYSWLKSRKVSTFTPYEIK